MAGDRYLRIKDLAKPPHSLPMSRPTIYRMIKRGEFCKPVKMGKASVWPESEIEAWVAAQKAAR